MGRKLKLAEPVSGTDVKVKELGKEVTKLTKEYTKQVKSIGAKYGIILDVKVLIESSESDT